MGQLGFFDAERRLAALSAKGDPLEAIDRLVPWESFRRSFDDIRLLGFDFTGPRVAALFELYALPFYQQVEDFVAIIDVDENIPAIVARNEAVPFILPKEFDRAVFHSNVLDP